MWEGTVQQDAVSGQRQDARIKFIRQTYLHLAGAVGAFVLVSFFLFSAGVGESMVRWLTQSGKYSWLLVLGGLMVVSWLATTMASSSRSIGVQYAGLGVYVVGEALIFAPLFWLVTALPNMGGVLPMATILTLSTFGALSAYVILLKKDFSWMGSLLAVLGVVAIGAIVCAAIFGFTLGLWFSIAMILFAAGAILYSTSNVMNKFGTDQYVAAALQLFAAILLLFWYVLRLLMELRR
jgi:FtsH-binding integral membrane protein